MPVWNIESIEQRPSMTLEGWRLDGSIACWAYSSS
jgi:hypothetical protein